MEIGTPARVTRRTVLLAIPEVVLLPIGRAEDVVAEQVHAHDEGGLRSPPYQRSVRRRAKQTHPERPELDMPESEVPRL